VIRALIIGYGSIGKRHAKVLHEQLGLSVEVVSRRVHSDYLSYQSIAACNDLTQYDYFIIATETMKHREQLFSIDSSVCEKQIFVEKPLFADGMSAPELSGRNTVWVGYNLRFHPVIGKIRELIKDKRVLSVNCMAGEYLPWWRPNADYRDCYSARRELGGGVLLDLSHEIDYLQWLFGDFLRAVVFIDKISGLEINSEDISTAVARTSRGCIVNVTLDYLSMIPVRKMLIHTDHCSIDADLEHGMVILTDESSGSQKWSFATERDDTYREMHKAILHDNGLNCCTYDEGLSVMRTIELLRKNNVKDLWYAT
jgi:CMP-N,N'-diacetyllegionaminic acid synthase